MSFDRMVADLTNDRAPERVDLREHMEALIAEHGSMNKAADARGVDRGEFCRVFNGQRPASDTVLEKLGLRRVVYFERI